MSKKPNSLLIIALMLFSIFSLVIVSAVTVEDAVSGYYEVSYSDYNVTDTSYTTTENGSLTITLGGVDDGVEIDENDSSTYASSDNVFVYMPMWNETPGTANNVTFYDGLGCFNGNDGYITLGNDNLSGNYISQEFIINPVVNNTEQALYWKSSQLAVGLYDDGRFRVLINGVGTGLTEWHYSTTSIPTGINTSIMWNWDNEYIRIYVNGVLETVDPMTGTRQYTTNPADIGARYYAYNDRYFNGCYDRFTEWNATINQSDITQMYTGYTGTSAKLGEHGEWKHVINGQVQFENVTAGTPVYILSTYPTTADTATFRYDYPTDNITLIEESISGNDVNINISYIPSNNYSVATINYTPSNYPMYFVDMDTTDANATFSYGIDGIIEILTSSLSSGVEYFYNFTASLYMDAPENLNAISDSDHVHLEWDIVSGADNYSVCIPLPAMYNLSYEGITPPPNDGTFNQTIANFSQNGILRSPNPIDPLTVERIYAVHDENYIYMGANTYDNDANALDDRIGVYIDVLQDGLTTDDRGWQIREDGTLTYFRWSGTAWINAGVTGASAAVTGAGTTNPQYTLQIPKSELVGIAGGNHIDLIVRRTNTDGATTYTFFPDSTGYTILTTDGWQDLYMSPYDTPEGLYCQYTTDNFFNATGLDSYSEYTFIVSGMFEGITGNSSIIKAVTLDYPTYSITGTVYDIDTLSPIQNSIVTITDSFTIAFTTTDSNGNYTLENLHNDDYTLVASKNGYFDNFTFVTVSDDNVTNANIYLNNEPYATDEQIYLPWQIYGTMFGFTILMTLYAFLHRDFENYTHVLAALVSGGVNFLLGNATFIGIVFIESDLYYYSSEIWGRFHIIWGGINILLVVIFIMDLARRSQLEKEVKDEFELTGGR